MTLAAPSHDRPSGISPTDNAPPYVILRPEQQTSCVFYASPHSGRHYPSDFIQQSCLDPITLRRSEDAFVDELYEKCIHLGSPLIKATFPRAYVDLNREPFELDPDMFNGVLPDYANIDSPRALSGLGTIAGMVTKGAPIYNNLLSFNDIRQRIDLCYFPYHAALNTLIEETRLNFGACLLIDCHSMPSHQKSASKDQALRHTDIVLGDRFGTSCAEWITDYAQSILTHQGFAVRRNRPYAGGFTTSHYSQTGHKIHTLQIEINRALYMDEDSITRRATFHEVKQRLSLLIEALSSLDPNDL